MGEQGDPLEIVPTRLQAKAAQCKTECTLIPGPAHAPDALEITVAAMDQLAKCSERMLATLRAGNTEGTRLGEAFDSAAEAFGKVDQEAEIQLANQMNGSEEMRATSVTVIPTAVTTQKPFIGEFSFPASADWNLFTEWRTAARTIHSGDTQALSVKYMRDQWNDQAAKLRDHVAKNFPSGDNLGVEGGAVAEMCSKANTSLGSWWGNMADECTRLALEAQKLADAHDKLVADHPTMDDVENFESINWALAIPGAKAAQYATFQVRSEMALREYANGTDIMEIRPGKPPSISGMPTTTTKTGTENPPPGVSNPNDQSAPRTGGPTSEGQSGPSVAPTSASPSSGEQSSGSPSGESPSGGSPSGGGSPSSGGGSPSGSGMPSGMPEGMPEMPGLDDPSLKPASAGGGMGGGGGGMGAGPLGPSVGAETVAASPAGARGAAGPAAAPSGGGMGGMGGGMGGMGGGHGQQGKEKRRDPKLAEDEDLYIEDRAYTEGVIGRRARRDVKDGKQ